MKRKAPVTPSRNRPAAARRPADSPFRAAAGASVTSWLLQPRTNPTDHVRILVGPAGCGKTHLTRDVADHPRIRAAFRDGIFRVDVGPRPLDLPRQLAAIGAAMGDLRAEEYATRESALDRLVSVLARKSVLLVFDDVWDLHQALELQALRHPGRTLLVTRNTHLAEAFPEAAMDFPAFSVDEAAQLLAGRTGQSHPKHTDIAERLLANPLGITLASALLHKGMRPGDWIDTFDSRPSDGPDDLDARLRAGCTINLMYVPAERCDLFFALALFQPRIALPETAIDRAWRLVDASLTDYDRRLAVDELLGYALLDRRGNAFAVHDLLVQLARESLDDRLPVLHERFLDSYMPRQRPWPEVSDDGYIHRFLGYHLHEARRFEILRGLLLDFDWIQKALAITDMTTVQDDYALLHEDKTLRLVQEALWLSARTLTRDPSQLPAQLIARLSRFDIVAIERFIRQVRQRIDRRALWLEPRNTCLATPGSALLDTYHGHLDVVRSVAVTPDGRQVLSGSEDATVKLWDIATGNVAQTLYGHTAGVQAVAVSPIEPLAYSASDDGTIRIWELERGAERLQLLHHTGRVLSLAVMPDGKNALSAGEEGSLCIWDARSGILRKQIDTGNRQIWSMAPMPDGRRLVTASDSRAVSIWNLATGELERTLAGHTDWVWAVAVSPEGDQIVSASEDRNVIVWDAGTGRIVRVLKGHRGAVRSVAVAADGATAVTASEDQSLIVWDLRTGAILRTFTGHDDWVWHVALAPDGLTAFSASDDHAIKRWSLSAMYRHPDTDAHTKSVRAIRISPDYLHAATVSDDQTARLWRLSDGAHIASLSGHRDWIWDAAFSPSGRHLVSASFDTSLRLWNVMNEQAESVLEGHTDWIWAVRVAPDGRHLVSASEDGTLGVWRLEDGQLVHRLTGHEGGVTALCISQDSRVVVSASADTTIRLWSLEGGHLLKILTGHLGPVRALHVSDLSQRILSGSDDGTIRSWSLLAGTPDMELPGHTRPVRHLRLLSIGIYLISAAEDRTIRLWDLTTGENVHTFDGHSDEIRDIEVSPDGHYLASVSDDHSVRLWDLDLHTLAASFYADFPVTSCAFSNDGLLLLLGDAGGGVHMLEINE